MRQFIHQIGVLYQKHYQLLAYLFFGVLTTLVNTVAYGLFYYTLGVSNAASTVLAWAAAVNTPGSVPSPVMAAIPAWAQAGTKMSLYSWSVNLSP